MSLASCGNGPCDPGRRRAARLRPAGPCSGGGWRSHGTAEAAEERSLDARNRGRRPPSRRGCGGSRGPGGGPYLLGRHHHRRARPRRRVGRGQRAAAPARRRPRRRAGAGRHLGRRGVLRGSGDRRDAHQWPGPRSTSERPCREGAPRAHRSSAPRRPPPRGRPADLAAPGVGAPGAPTPWPSCPSRSPSLPGRGWCQGSSCAPWPCSW